MINKRIFPISAAMAAVAMLVAACSLSGKKEKPVVTVQCGSLSEDFQLAIEKQCPDVEIKWVLTTHSHENLIGNLKELPDILCMSSFYADKKPAPYLKDLSGEINISDYSRNVIENFMGEDGSIYWIPIIGNAHFILANKSVFRKYGVELPHDYNSLVAADKAFKSHGIDGLAWGMSKAWTFSAMLAAQPLCADLFNSYDGMIWRNKLKDAGADGQFTLDDVLWPAVFRRVKDAFDCGLIDEKDFHETTVTTSDKLRFGEVAMAVSTSNNLYSYRSDDFVAIPFFDSTGTAWVPIYLGLSFAVSNQVSDERFLHVKKVLDAIMSSASLKAYNESRGGAYPMNNDVEAVPDHLDALKKATEEGFSFLLFNEENGSIINGFYKAMSEMLEENLCPEEACERARKYSLEYKKGVNKSELLLNTDDPEHLVFESDVTYPHRTDQYKNNPVASCLTNTILASVNHLSPKKYDILVTLPSLAGAPIEAGSYYYDKQGNVSFGSGIYFLFGARRCFYPASMTVAELMQYLNNSFYYFHRIDDGLPVMAGASYAVEKYDEGIPDSELPFTPGKVNAGNIANTNNFPTRYICKAIIKDGKELPLDEKLEVLVARENVFYMTEHTNEWESTWAGFRPMLSVQNSEGKEIVSSQDLFLDWVAREKKPCEPTRYLYIRDATVK